MRIDGTNGLPPQGTPEPAQPSQKLPRPSDSADAKVGGDDLQIRSSLDPYVRAALAGEEVDEQAVAEARRLMESGQLDSPEAARRAAEALLRDGI